MKRIITTGLAALLAFSFGIGPVTHVMAQTKVVRITLIDENGSGEDGSAQITDQGDGTTKVELIMTNQPQGSEQPAGVHEGTCTSLDPDVAFALDPVKSLKSTSTIKTPLSTLLNNKYAIAVTKSASDSTVISCGIFPSAAVAAGGTLTMDQVMTQLIDQATELLGEIQKKEVDGSQNAYNAFHATFAAHESDIKAKSPQDQAEIEAAMNEVSNALGAGKWDEAATAAQELVQKAKDAQAALAGAGSGSTATSGSADLLASLSDLEGTANDLVREIGNKDKAGATAAWNEFHTDFAAREGALLAKSPADQTEIEVAMNEANAAIQAGDWAKASSAAAELLQKVKDAEGAIRADSALPNGGAGDTFLPLAIGLVALACGLVSLGAFTRRKAMR